MKRSPHLTARQMALLGSLSLTLCSALPWTAHAAEGSYLLTFSFNPIGPLGSAPLQAPVQGRDAQSYGTTQEGGGSNCGAVYQVGTRAPVVDAHTTDCAPLGLMLASNGKFYGIAYTDNQGNGSHLFNMTLSGKATINTLAPIPGGGYANSLPIQGADGKLYGVADHGGANGYGLIYVYSPVNDTAHPPTATLLYSLTQTDGIDPSGSLVIGADGRFYGTTLSGGAYGKGTIFAITMGGQFTKLYDVPNTTGALEKLRTPMTLGNDGALYGVAQDGGAFDKGAIFRLTVHKTKTGVTTAVNTVFNFHLTSEGSSPVAGLAFDSDDNLYGATAAGGKSTGGVLFRLIPDESVLPAKYAYQALHNFQMYTNQDGWTPLSGPVVDTGGGINGVAPNGGFYFMPSETEKAGMVYGYITGAKPVVIPVPTAARPGQVIGLVGESFIQDLTSVSFGDVNIDAKSVKVLSSNYLQVQVPTSLTTGQISVTVTTLQGSNTYQAITAVKYPIVSQ